jgi:exodeoxyribonuclease VII large subunit
MAATDQGVGLEALSVLSQRLHRGLRRQQDRQAQRLDMVAARLSRPQAMLGQHKQWLDRLASRLHAGLQSHVTGQGHQLERLSDRLGFNRSQQLPHRAQRLARAALRLASVDPRQVLERGYAWLSDEQGQALTQAAQLRPGQSVRATLADGDVPLKVMD